MFFLLCIFKWELVQSRNVQPPQLADTVSAWEQNVLGPVWRAELQDCADYIDDFSSLFHFAAPGLQKLCKRDYKPYADHNQTSEWSGTSKNINKTRGKQNIKLDRREAICTNFHNWH